MDIESQLSTNQGLEVTVWHPSDSSVEISFSCKLLEKDPPFFLVDVPPKLEPQLAAVVAKGLRIGVLAHSNNPIIFYPLVEHFQQAPPRGYWLKVPPDGRYETVQRRSHVRINMIVPIQIDYGPNYLFKVKGMTLDVSGGGMKFNAPVVFKRDQLLLIHLKFSDDQPLLVLNAKVIFSRDNTWSRSPQEAYTTACQFYEMTEQQQTVIMGECFRRELGLRNR